MVTQRLCFRPGYQRTPSSKQSGTGHLKHAGLCKTPREAGVSSQRLFVCIASQRNTPVVDTRTGSVKELSVMRDGKRSLAELVGADKYCPARQNTNPHHQHFLNTF